jgi:predicted nucleic acid-binding protein
MSAPSNPQGSVVIDANVLIAICSKEAGRHIKAEDRLKHYGQQGWHLYAPGVIVAETLYVLCGKYQSSPEGRSSNQGQTAGAGGR